ncbi:transglutaminase domain-containing protein [uncultured Imperialibacter sp.]|uniref:transglutaminase domain-containing protein n=1 Tax=uncultured Imperialibacter sp. TaxID=1672639 RepID=UPI0030DD22E8|tara:strand:- start:16081 stop:17112 length:1032 start_codon:yes stop_codon:yes gene_type:complete
MAKSSQPVLKRMLLFGACLLATMQLLAQSPTIAQVDFARADSVARLYHGYSLANLNDLSHKLTHPFTNDLEKFRAIYRWVCNNIDNDFDYFERNQAKRKKLLNDADALDDWNRKFAPQVFKRLLQQHSTVCTGYAYLIRELAYHADIESVIVDGYGRNAEANIGGPGVPNHSWNAVQLSGQWYLCDATWSSGTIDTQQGLFIKQFREAYFLTPPELFVRNHYPLDTRWLLMEAQPSLTSYLNGPLVYNDGIGQEILPVAPATFNVAATRKVPITFRFSAPIQPEELTLQIVQGSHVLDLSPKVTPEADGLYNITHTFPARGTYALHVRNSGDYLFTYEVRIAK